MRTDSGSFEPVRLFGNSERSMDCTFTPRRSGERVRARQGRDPVIAKRIWKSGGIPSLWNE